MKTSKGLWGTFSWVTARGESEEKLDGEVVDQFTTPNGETLYKSADGRWWNTFKGKE